MSRRSLETGFRKFLGRSPLAEIYRVRGEKIKDLLVQTDLSIEQIAERSGFKDIKRLYVVFRRMTGTSPARWRRQVRRDGYMPQPLSLPPENVSL
jgi:LacI family transcriptional regulator